MNTSSLFVRRLFHHDDEDKTVCPVEDITGPPIIPFVGNLSFHAFATILSGACPALSFLIIAVVITFHALHYSNPIQQRQIIRIILLIPWIAFFAFLIVWQEGAGEYLVESLDFGCAIALAAFLLLMCDYILASPMGADELLGAGSAKRKNGKEDSPKWFKRIWYMCLQFVPMSLMIWVVTCITLATNVYCSTSNSGHFAKIWITVAKVAVTTLAVLADLRLYKAKYEILKPHGVLSKFFAFKGIIGLNMIQRLVIGVLVGNKTLHPTEYLTYNDVNVGLSSLILACEMPLFAILVAFAFPVTAYRRGQSPAAGPLTAVAEALNITDLLSCFVRGPMRLVREQQWGIQRQDSMSLIRNAKYPPAYIQHGSEAGTTV